MEIRYDSESDAAYIQLVEDIVAGGVDHTVMCDPSEVGGMIHLDFDANGVLVGIEVLGASSKLPPKLLAQALRNQHEGPEPL